MQDKEEMVKEVTTPYFDGYSLNGINNLIAWYPLWIINIVGLLRGFKRVTSQNSKYCNVLESLVPGIYAIKTNGKLPDYIVEELQEMGIPLPEE